MIVCLSNGRQPQLDELVVPPHVNVRRSSRSLEKKKNRYGPL
jgi:hypothetical protein